MSHRKRRRKAIITAIVCLAFIAGVATGLFFVFYRSESSYIKVPKIVGLSYREAASKVKSAGLKIKIEPGQDVGGAAGIEKKNVVTQDPEEGSNAEKGALVTVRLEGVKSKGKDTSGKEEPDGKSGGEKTVATGHMVCIDPGHSANCPGSQIDPETGLDVADNEGAEGELQTNWDLAIKTKAVLEQTGYTVKLAKPSAYSYASLRERPEIGNTCEIVIRLHFDPGLHAILYPGVGQSKSHGGSTVTVDPDVSQKSGVLANALFPYLKTVGITKIMNDCGGTSNNTGSAFVGSVLSRVPVVLIENDPEMVLENPNGQTQVASAILQGVNSYFQGL